MAINSLSEQGHIKGRENVESMAEQGPFGDGAKALWLTTSLRQALPRRGLALSDAAEGNAREPRHLLLPGHQIDIANQGVFRFAVLERISVLDLHLVHDAFSSVVSWGNTSP